MQTFLPHPDFGRSARSLDTRRLGKQRVECLQVLRGLTVPGYGWRHHPAVRMWEGPPRPWPVHAHLLRGVDRAGLRRHVRGVDPGRPRGRRGDAGPRAGRSRRGASAAPLARCPDFHRSHQSAPLRKDPELYGPQFPGVPDDLPYVWPTP